MTVYFKLVDENKEIFKGEIDKLNVTSVGGELTILPNHAPLLTIIKEGGKICVHHNKKIEFYSIFGGVLSVKKKEILVLAKKVELMI